MPDFTLRVRLGNGSFEGGGTVPRSPPDRGVFQTKADQVRRGREGTVRRWFSREPSRRFFAPGADPSPVPEQGGDRVCGSSWPASVGADRMPGSAPRYQGPRRERLLSDVREQPKRGPGETRGRGQTSSRRRRRRHHRGDYQRHPRGQGRGVSTEGRAAGIRTGVWRHVIGVGGGGRGEGGKGGGWV